MTMMIRFLLLPLCLMHLNEVAGTITLSTDSSLVDLRDEVALTCKDTEKKDIEIHFGGQSIGSCILIPKTTCSIENQTLYSASIDTSQTGYNLMTLTIKSFAVSNCGEYTCLKKMDPCVKHTATVENKLYHGDSCAGACGQCYSSNLLSCSASSTCKCNTGHTFKDTTCEKCTGCCWCIKYKKEKVACCVVLGLCVYGMVLLGVYCNEDLHPKSTKGKCKLIGAIIFGCVVLCGFILSFILLCQECVNAIGVSRLVLNCIQVVLIAVSACIKLFDMRKEQITVASDGKVACVYLLRCVIIKDTALSKRTLALMAFATGGIFPCLLLLLLVVCKKEKSCRAKIGVICLCIGIMLSYIEMGFNIHCITADGCSSCEKNSCWNYCTKVVIGLAVVGLFINIVSVIVAIWYMEKDEPCWVVYLSIIGILIAFVGQGITILDTSSQKKPDGNAGAGNNCDKAGGALNVTRSKVDPESATANDSIN